MQDYKNKDFYYSAFVIVFLLLLNSFLLFLPLDSFLYSIHKTELPDLYWLGS